MKNHKKAVKAASYLEQQLGIENCCQASLPPSYARFDPDFYLLKLTHQTYGPYLDDFVKKLDLMPNVRPSENVIGFDINSPFYEIDTPFGTYKVVFEYFDNHGCGV